MEIYSRDSEEIDELVKNLGESNIKQCEACGKLFVPYTRRNRNRIKFCNRVHYCICPVCGKEFEVNFSAGIDCIKRTCSRSCSNKLKMQSLQSTMIDKYGVTNASQLQDHKEKVKKTCREKYGSDSYSQSDEFKQKAREAWKNKTQEELQERLDKSIATNQSRYGVDNGSQTEEAKVKQKETNRKRYGKDWYRQTDECDNRIRETTKEKYGDEIYFRTDDYKNKFKKTCQSKYGVDHFTQSDGFKENMKKSLIEKHGVSCIFQTEENKKKLIDTNRKKYGVDYALSSSVVQEKSKNTMLEKYGVEYALQSDDLQNKAHDGIELKYGVRNAGQVDSIRKKIQQTSKSDECRQKFEDTMMSKFGVRNPAQSSELRRNAAISCKRSITCDGTYVDSSYEKIVYDFCVRNNLEFETQIPISYEFEGREHKTFIDFKIDDVLFETKGHHLLEGVYDYAENIVPISVKLDVYKKNHVVIITDSLSRNLFGSPNSLESNGFNYQDKCPYPLIGVDIKLFDNPIFPQRDDRPLLFYRVKVNNQMCSYDAFYDEKIRWKMIKNRIMYSGGFIDSNQILTAMNVSRVCKQPSWFSKSFAKEIISKYATSDVIVDTFAGWGMRHDASVDLHKTYIGCDLNEELVAWHRSKKRNIKLGDAKQFKYNGECSVFICPPYQDVEIYFDDQDVGLTQCEWLQIVMNNIPNANEYIMVCKVVDEGWKNYIVDKKINRSHYGENAEYILVVKNNKLI